MLTLDQFNAARGTSFAANERNLKELAKLNACNTTPADLAAIPHNSGAGYHDLRACAAFMQARRAGQPAPAAPEAKPAAPAPAPAAAPAVKAPATTDADALIKALNSVLKVPQMDAAEIKRIVEAAVDEKLQAVKQAPQHFTVKTPDKINTVKGTPHACFEDVLTLIADGQPVYLYGPAGTGKTVLAGQIAEALGLPFHYSGQLSQEYKFTGFTDANGRFQPTPFYKAFTEGGVFFLDEMDRSFCDVLTDLNGALANGIFDFPAPIGVKKAHPDFRCIAAGNTLGRGAVGGYVAANALDASTLDRFMMIEVGYDRKIENAINEEAAEFVRTLRKAAGLAGLDIVLSYREIKKLAKYSKPLGIAKAIKAAITAPLSKDDINTLIANAGIKRLAEAGNAYAAALIAA